MADSPPAICLRCGSQVREEQAHIRCPQCGVIEACCEGAALLYLNNRKANHAAYPRVPSIPKMLEIEW